MRTIYHNKIGHRYHPGTFHDLRTSSLRKSWDIEPALLDHVELLRPKDARVHSEHRTVLQGLTPKVTYASRRGSR
jgi:hypothetical protein